MAWADALHAWVATLSLAETVSFSNVGWKLNVRLIRHFVDTVVRSFQSPLAWCPYRCRALLRRPVDLLQTRQKSTCVGDLDGQSRPSVRFQQHRPLCRVHHDIDTQVAQPGCFGDTARHVKDLAPVRYTHPDDGDPGIRMAVDKTVALHSMVGDSSHQIHAGADPALVQIGPAIGCLGGQASIAMAG